MADQWPVPNFIDGDFTAATPISLPVLSAPIPGVKDELILTQEFVQFRKNHSPLALNTAHPSSGKTPDYSTFLLVEESEREDYGAGVCKWTRKYAKVPSSHDEWETYAYQFCGIVNVSGVNIPVVQGRDPFSWVVTSRVQHDYFLVNPALSSDSPPIYKSPGNIPNVDPFLYVNQGTYSGTTYGGVYFPTDSTFDYTFPTTSQYQDMIEDAITNGWSATVSNQVIDTNYTIKATGVGGSTLGGQIVAEPSQLSRWNGNIWVRRTRYVLAM
jgi:hypothetical protein